MLYLRFLYFHQVFVSASSQLFTDLFFNLLQLILSRKPCYKTIHQLLVIFRWKVAHHRTTNWFIEHLGSLAYLGDARKHLSSWDMKHFILFPSQCYSFQNDVSDQKKRRLWGQEWPWPFALKTFLECVELWVKYNFIYVMYLQIIRHIFSLKYESKSHLLTFEKPGRKIGGIEQMRNLA